MSRGRGIIARARVGMLLALLLSSCAVARTPGESLGADYGKDAPPPKLTSRVPSQAPSRPTGTTPAGAPPVVSGLGAFELTVTAPNGARLPGVVLAYKGPSTGTVTTDGSGVARAQVKPGSYAIDTRECGTAIKIVLGGGADFTVSAGGVTRGEVGGIGWEPRFQPRVEVATGTKPPWRVGSPFTLKVRVGDECYDSAPVRRSVSIDPYRYETEAPMQLSGTPSMRTDANGWLTARFVCTSPGDGDIAVSDPRIGTRYTSVLGAVAKPAESGYCIS